MLKEVFITRWDSNVTSKKGWDFQMQLNVTSKKGWDFQMQLLLEFTYQLCLLYILSAIIYWVVLHARYFTKARQTEDLHTKSLPKGNNSIRSFWDYNGKLYYRSYVPHSIEQEHFWEHSERGENSKDVAEEVIVNVRAGGGEVSETMWILLYFFLAVPYSTLRS